KQKSAISLHEGGIKLEEEIRQAIDATKEQQPVAVSLEWYQDTIKLPEIKEFIRANINAASRSFVAIGYYLKYVRDNQLYKEDGYESIWDFAQNEFGFSQSWASRCMLINDRFSKEGNSPIVLDQFKGFDKSKLSEMLTLTDNQLEQITISTTVAEIKDIKKAEKSHATSHKEVKPEKEETVLASEQKAEQPKCDIRDRINASGENGLTCSGFDLDQCNDCDKYDPPAIHTPVLIDDLDFTVRTYNCLKRAGIDTVEQLCELTETEVIIIRNISQKCLDEIKLKLSEIGRGLKPEDIPEIVNDEPEIVDIETESENDVDETVNETSESVIEEPEDVIATNVFDCPCDTCGHEIQGCCGYDTKDDYCVLGNKWVAKDPDPVETVEADIIQTVPVNTMFKRVPIGLADANGKQICEGDILLHSSDTYHVHWYQIAARFVAERVERRYKHADMEEWPIHRISECAVLYSIYGDEPKPENPVSEEPEPVQPVLPILKNNDQRKEFIEAYMTWPIWIDLLPTGERYYRYNLTVNIAIVVKVSKRHIWKNYKETDEIDFDHEEYYLLGVKTEYHSNGTIIKVDTSKTFFECSSNKSQLVDYLKYFQKKGA
ncbi:MAG: DNA-directed polymerase subunit alpha, partial [Herbinix sp.]|nr:DNA-directed polymerase subunit alpha [Herbinix sp.]